MMRIRVVRCSACRSALHADVLAAIGDKCPRCHRSLGSAFVAGMPRRKRLVRSLRAPLAAAVSERADPRGLTG